MRIAGGNYQTRFGARADRPAWLRRLQKLKLDRKLATLLVLLCAVPITMFVLVKAASVYFAPTSATPPPLKTAPAASPPVAAAAPTDNLTTWTTLEPAYRAYKVAISEDSSLKLNGRPAQLYGFRVIPRTTICTYANGDRWACGQRAYIALLNLVGSTTIDCLEKNKGVPIDIDTPRSFECRLPGTDIAELMLTEGWGTTEPGVTEPRYQNAAARARLMKAGMWQTQPPGSS